MIIYRDIIPFNSEIKNILMEDEFKKLIHNKDEKFSTTYKNNINYKGILEKTNSFYSEIFSRIMKYFLLYNNTKYKFSFWYQIYDKDDSGHLIHDHFLGPEIFSWVHFISLPQSNCFHFKNGIENNFINEKENDFIIFPSWAHHAVNPPSSGKRIVCAGNVSLLYYNKGNTEMNLKYSQNQVSYMIKS